MGWSASGRKGKCPGCGRPVMVPRYIPEDAGPLLVPADDGPAAGWDAWIL